MTNPSNADATSYDIKIKALDDYNPTPSSHVIHWVIKENEKPHFDGVPSPAPTYLDTESHLAYHSYTYTLPTYSDPEGEAVTVSISLNGATFANASNTDGTIKVGLRSTSNADASSYFFSVTLSDGNTGN